MESSNNTTVTNRSITASTSRVSSIDSASNVVDNYSNGKSSVFHPNLEFTILYDNSLLDGRNLNVFDENLPIVNAEPRENLANHTKRKRNMWKIIYDQFSFQQRRNRIFLVLTLLFSIISTWFQNGLVKGKLQVRRQPEARRFFSPTSPVVDLYDGNQSMVQELLVRGESIMVMYYAPWSSHSNQARFHFDRLARTVYGIHSYSNYSSSTVPNEEFGSPLTFVAVNCWQPEGQCRRSYKLYSYPVIALYNRATGSRGIYYYGIVSADYLLTFLTRALNPLQRVNNVQEFQAQLVSNENLHIVAYIELASKRGRQLYDSFYKFALRILERDPLRDEMEFLVVTNSFVAGNLNLAESGSIASFHWLSIEKLSTYQQTEWNLQTTSYNWDNFTSWLGTHNLNKTSWIYSKSTKDDRLYNFFNDQPTVVMFTKRQPLITMKKEVAVFSEVSRRYWAIDKRRLQLSIESIWQKLNESRSDWTLSKQSACNLDQISSPCRQWPISAQIYRNFCLSRNMQRFSSPGDLNKHFCTKSCLSSKNSYCSKTPLPCARFMLSYLLKYPNLEQQGTPGYAKTTFEKSDIDFLAQRSNVTMQFIILDGQHYSYVARNLGIDLDEKYGTGVAIVDFEGESTYTMPVQKDFSVENVIEFVLDYKMGRLRRFVRSQKLEAGLSLSKKPQNNGKNLELTQISSATFEAKVLLNSKDVLLLFHAPWCAMCQQFYHVFHAAKFYFRKYANSLEFMMVDVDENDLPWQYTMDSLPTILYFKSGRPENVNRFPKALPLTLPNLISFILSQSSWHQRLQFAFDDLCNGDCLEKNFFFTQHRIRAAQRNLIRWLAVSNDKDYFWDWQDDESDFGKIVPIYMNGIWRQIKEAHQNLRALRLLNEMLLKKRKTFARSG